MPAHTGTGDRDVTANLDDPEASSQDKSSIGCLLGLYNLEQVDHFPSKL